ncbi:MAG: EAL domain-containing protein [Peptostreptococcaceae bacterium]|nr:EAL domain-containing protein [Peptostreptococcaceae bacterium]
MFTLPMVISLAYYFVFLIYLSLGIYVFSLNRKETPNRIFSLICLSLCIWSFCFSMQNFGKNPPQALFWGKIASFGWSFFYSLILHFALILTQKEKLLRRPLAYLLLYLPALINQYFFFFAKDSSRRYEYVYAPFGWTDIRSRSGLLSDPGLIYFSFFFGISAAIGIAALAHFALQTKDVRKKKQAILINSAFFLMTVVSLLSDRLLFWLFRILTPQSSVLFMTIPMAAFFYAIKKYDLMQSAEEDPFVMREILSLSRKKKIYFYLICFFLFYGLILFGSLCFVKRYDPLPALSSCVLFFAVAFSIAILRTLPLSELLRDILITAAICLCIFFATLSFSNSAAVTVWVFPAALLYLSIIMNYRFMIVAISLTAIAAQIASYLRAPYLVVHVDGANYILRIALSLLSLLLAIHVNRIYIEKLRENNSRLLFQKTISDIYASFISINQINFSSKTDEMLEDILSYTGAQRSYFFSLSENDRSFYLSNESCAEGIEPIKNYRRKFFVSEFPRLFESILEGRTVNTKDIEALPETDLMRDLLREGGIRSQLLLPIKSRGKTIGCLGLESSKPEDLFEKHGELLILLSSILSDALTKMQAADSINFMAYYDDLTKLPNRALFTKQLEKYILLAKRDSSILGVISVDIDNFQYVNDTIGHNGGDELLVFIAGQIGRQSFGKSMISRFGGDEFSLMLHNVGSLDEIREFCEQIMDIFRQPVRHCDREFFITASFGVAVYPTDGEDAETLIKNSDLAMYESKNSGKNQYRFCSDRMKKDISRKMELTSSLHQALEKKELALHYQPQVSVKDGRITGIEALLRWNEHRLGEISPDIFIPLAEETGLIRPIGNWMLDAACRQMKEWIDRFGLEIPLAVHISLQQLKDRRFIHQLKDSLEKASLAPRFLELEILESSDLEENKDLPLTLQAIRSLGVFLSMDDFGTRYSSLSSLKHLPLHRLKIDLQFIHGIRENAKDRGVTKSIIDLGKNLNFRVIAEGVETKEQFDFLKEQGCDEIQGNYFYPAMDAQEIGKLFHQIFPSK